MDEIKTMLKEECKTTLQAVKEAKAGSEEAKWQLEKLDALHKHLMTEQQFESESAVKERELRIKEQQLKDGKKDRIIKIGGDALALAVIPLSELALKNYWMGKSLKFEETGTFTDRSGQWVSGFTRLFKSK